MYVCMYVCMDGWMDGWMDVCMCVCRYITVYVCMYVCRYIAILRLLGAPCAILSRLEPSWGRSWAVLSVSCCEPRPSWPVLGPPEVKMSILYWF